MKEEKTTCKEMHAGVVIGRIVTTFPIQLRVVPFSIFRNSLRESSDFKLPGSRSQAEYAMKKGDFNIKLVRALGRVIKFLVDQVVVKKKERKKKATLNKHVTDTNCTLWPTRRRWKRDGVPVYAYLRILSDVRNAHGT